jgi:hypothetical protein
MKRLQSETAIHPALGISRGVQCNPILGTPFEMWGALVGRHESYQGGQNGDLCLMCVATDSLQIIPGASFTVFGISRGETRYAVEGVS